MFSGRSVIAVAAAIFTVVLIVWFYKATPVVDLSINNNFNNSKLYDRWVRGDVVVMVRHAERCDRSGNPCLGSADGITVNGSQSARAVGVGLQQMGLGNSRIIASPLTRTRQTADLILGRAVPTQSWASDCSSGFKDAVLAHKQVAQNLVLITHSGCIDQFERKMGVRAGDRSSDYAQAVFVKVDGKHAPSIIGAMDAAQWKNITIGQVN
ncbi:histidine phosphatase family protein [Pseudomonas sp. DOAB1069]|uniref:Histidine phosphatase family protein n=2 Tax=Pseudomonas folii TaxID=2762593 RepID=A0ABR7B218_9PSED|nr:histidine phosphatase family protein [Pseudomonas folii]MBC3951236.1 histidine phosphatase family protein [Pseudomonas folii]